MLQSKMAQKGSVGLFNGLFKALDKFEDELMMFYLHLPLALNNFSLFYVSFTYLVRHVIRHI